MKHKLSDEVTTGKLREQQIETANRMAEQSLREQIAEEILSKCLENRHQGNDDGIGALTSDPSVIYYPETFRVCAKCEVAAAIARGEKK